MLDRLLHHLGRLQHEGQNQLAGAELVADFLHRRQQHFVEHAHRLLAHAGRVERRFDAVLLSVHDHPVNLLVVASSPRSDLPSPPRFPLRRSRCPRRSAR